MILTFVFEELRALAAGADLLLSGYESRARGAVAAPADTLALIETLRPRLTGDLSVTNLAEQRALRRAVGSISEGLHDQMEEKVLEYHPGHEEAVALYFDYAHTIAVLERLDAVGTEMTAMIELMTGAPPTEDSARSISFPD